MGYFRGTILIPAIIAGVALILCGLLCVASPNSIWKLQEIQNKWKGITSSVKPKNWDTLYTIYGVVLVVVGIAALAFGVYLANSIKIG